MGSEEYKLMYDEVLLKLKETPKAYCELLAQISGNDMESSMKILELQNKTLAIIWDDSKFFKKIHRSIVDVMNNTVLSDEACTKHAPTTPEQSLILTITEDGTLDENGNPEQNVMNKLYSQVNADSQDILSQNKRIQNHTTKMKSMVKSKPTPSQKPLWK